MWEFEVFGAVDFFFFFFFNLKRTARLLHLQGEIAKRELEARQNIHLQDMWYLKSLWILLFCCCGAVSIENYDGEKALQYLILLSDVLSKNLGSIYSLTISYPPPSSSIYVGHMGRRRFCYLLIL